MATLPWIDTHAHIYDISLSDKSPQLWYEKLKKEGIQQVYMPSISSKYLDAMELFRKNNPSFFKSMLGVHPCYVQEEGLKKILNLESLLQKKHFYIAIGETGLDFFHSTKYKELQYEALTIQINWAKKYNLPLVLHGRASLDQLIEVLKREQDGNIRAVFHCFTGNVKQAKEILNLGFYIGVGGMITFFNKRLLRNVIATLPIDRIVLETDSPFLAPAKYKEKHNSPLSLPIIGYALSQLMGIPISDLARQLIKNSLKLFSSDVRE